MDERAHDVISVRDLSVRYRRARTDAVRGMEFTVGAGEVFGFLGPSGAGKSTVQRVLTRLVRGYGGEVRVFGRPLPEWGREYYEEIGVGFELPAEFTRLTARENLEVFASLYRGPTVDTAELLDRVDLGESADQRVGGFSKGMRMRLSLARALLNLPRLLFLDEPTSGQDPVRAARLREVIRAEVDRGATVFLTTHDMRTAEDLCDRIAFVVDGRIAAIDTPDGFRRHYGHPGVVAEYVVGGRPHRRTFELTDLGAGGALSALVDSGSVTTLHTREATLDDVFAAVTQVRL
ncbi:ABC transporter ATP-binding protein [Spiractinospora alimapuensis]|uniref:ABC transporter ATP-binding protein n=1 Tax=Spiractinospora alimapuensis TaxID=2820884 RepID=UPI001F337312|nr:ABC transporter ATP-binding protein [Spiractinospora alimapuensis]QVQ52285.1 ABC transporter ATP-binding protein [Spiractinospora alimapuensis]